MDFSKLHEPFAADEIEWRAQQAGDTSRGPYVRVLAYVTNRAIMNRLDEVVGPGNWHNTYTDAPGGGILCGLSIRVPRRTQANQEDGFEWVTKWDAADQTDIEAVKGGHSNAMKRAAVQWGIGRYLYNLESNYAEISEERQRGSDWSYAKTKGGTEVWWRAPQLPDWALPGGTGSPHKVAATTPSDFVIPMGMNKGKKVKDVDPETLGKIVDWCREKGKYEDLVAAIEQHLG
jgi:hypothetical protein